MESFYHCRSTFNFAQAYNNNSSLKNLAGRPLVACKMKIFFAHPESRGVNGAPYPPPPPALLEGSLNAPV